MDVTLMHYINQCPDSATKINRLLEGYQVSRIVQVAAELNIYEHFKDDVIVTIEFLTEKLNGDSELIYRYLRALATLGLIDELPHRRFRNNMHTQYISIANSVMFGRESYECWEHLSEVLCGKHKGFQTIYGESIFSYLAKNDSLQDDWNKWNASTAQSWFSNISKCMPTNETIVDVGGGVGVLAKQLLLDNENNKVILYDLPSVISKIDIGDFNNLTDRLKLQSGNMLSSVPSGADTYILSRILFNWDDDKAIQILKNCQNSKKDTGRVIVIENTIPSLGDQYRSMFSVNDLNLQLMFGSKHHTENDIVNLIELAGMTVVRINILDNSLGTNWKVFEAV